MLGAIRGFLAERHPEALELALWVREVVLTAEQTQRARLPGLGRHRFRHPDAGYICAIYPRGADVRLLFEHGVLLDDPDALLKGEGTQTGHITVRARERAA